MSESKHHQAHTRFTYEDYTRWPPGERWEPIDGRAHAITAPSRNHQQLSGSLFAQICVQPEQHPCEVCAAPIDARLPDADEPDEETHTVVQPDISVVCDPSRLDEKGCRGAPDLIIGILSPGTATLDRIHKLALYERHKVHGFWIVDPELKGVEIRTLGPAGALWRARHPGRRRMGNGHRHRGDRSAD